MTDQTTFRVILFCVLGGFCILFAFLCVANHFMKRTSARFESYEKRLEQMERVQTYLLLPADRKAVIQSDLLKWKHRGFDTLGEDATWGEDEFEV